jgi:GAF domain-containing protein
MSQSQITVEKKGTLIASRARQIWLKMIQPHPSVDTIREFRRAQLLSILTLILSILFASALFSRPRTIGVFLAFGGISLVSYILSRTEYYRLGTYIFAYSFTAIGFLRIYEGTATSIESSITSTVHIALIISSVLLSQRGFVSLAFLTAIATFTAPIYSKAPVVESENILLTGGVILGIGLLLYSIQVFRDNLEKAQLLNLSVANRELQEVSQNLEKRILERTTELENTGQKLRDRALRYQYASEISQELTTNIDQQPIELLTRISRSVSEKLGYYHVGIFLIDSSREFAVLRATNSTAGQRMLERRHQLKVGGTGIVGYVSQSGRPRIALDTGTDAVFFNNPDLPNTRSEIALPLKIGENTIGVLDVQSEDASAFNEEDSNLLSTLANQMAVVIDNILFLDKNKYSTSSQIEKKLSRNPKGSVEGGYSYLPDGTISNAIQINQITMDKAITSGEPVIQSQSLAGIPASIAVPVKFRDQVIGVIQIEASEPNRRWTEDELILIQAISDRAAFALENARLYENTILRADQEQTIADITTQIGASTDFNRILQTTIQELGRALGASRSFIQLGTRDQNESGY